MVGRGSAFFNLLRIAARLTTSADHFLFERERAGAARWALYAVPKLADIDLQFGDGAAQSVAVHAQFARCAALVALVFLEHGENETLLELADAFRIKNVAAVHLQDKGF